MLTRGEAQRPLQEAGVSEAGSVEADSDCPLQPSARREGAGSAETEQLAETTLLLGGGSSFSRGSCVLTGRAVGC